MDRDKANVPQQFMPQGFCPRQNMDFPVGRNFLLEVCLSIDISDLFKQHHESRSVSGIVVLQNHPEVQAASRGEHHGG